MKDEIYQIELGNGRIGFHAGNHDKVLLDHLNLKVLKGELVALIGKNGTGKTTLLRSMMGLHYLLQGEVKIDQQNLQLLTPGDIARKIGFASTSLPDNPEMTVEELVRIGRYPYTDFFGLLRQDDHDKIKKAIHVCGIEHLRNNKLSELSDGERQKSMLARVFAQDTDVILLDEPTSFLDIPNKYEIFTLLSSLTEEGKTIIFTTHDLNIAGRYADKIWLIRGNSIIDGAPEDLFLGQDINEMFTSEKIELDKQSGEVIPRFVFQHSVILHSCESCEIAETWTRRALQRKGIAVAGKENDLKKTLIRVSISKEKNTFTWNLHYNDKNIFASTIYQFIKQLENLINHELN